MIINTLGLVQLATRAPSQEEHQAGALGSSQTLVGSFLGLSRQRGAHRQQAMSHLPCPL